MNSNKKAPLSTAPRGKTKMPKKTYTHELAMSIIELKRALSGGAN